MINFIIEEEKLKEVIDNYMMNYNYTYDIKIYDSYKENNYFNIYILNYDSKNILDINKIKRIRYELDDWSSIIILLIKNDKDKYSLFDKRFMILDIISTTKDFKERLKEDILISIKNLDKKNNISTLSVQAINNFIGARINGDISIKVAIEPDDWETYCGTNGQYIEAIHDYGTIDLDDSYTKRLSKIKKW